MLLNGHIACRAGFEFRKFFNATSVSAGEGQSKFFSRSLTRHIWTFDDALKDITSIYSKYFKDEGKVFQFFVCPDLVNNWEQGNIEYVRNKLGNKDAIMLSWDEINKLIEEGNIIGSHGIDHASFSTMNETQMVDQLERSREMIRDKTGCYPNSFAFPYGKVSNKIDVTKLARNSYSEVYFSDNSSMIGEISEGVFNRRHCEFGSCAYRGLLIGYLNVVLGIRK